MDTNIKPSTMMLLGGGALLFISTLLDWRDFSGAGGANGWETTFWGLQGIIVAFIGLAVLIGTVLNEFTEVKMPEVMLGLDANQRHLLLGAAAFLLTFGQIGASNLGLGVHLGWIAAGVIVAAAVMDQRAGAPGTPGAPTEF